MNCIGLNLMNQANGYQTSYQPRTEEFYSSSSSSSSPSSPSSSIKRRLSNLLPICVALVVIAKIGFLGWLDKVALVDTLTDFFSQSLSLSQSLSMRFDQNNELMIESYEDWLTREDSVTYSRDLSKDPIFLSGGEKDFQSCSVECTFGDGSGKKLDAAFGLGHQAGTLSYNLFNGINTILSRK